MRAHEIIAATFSTDAPSISDMRYQPTRTRTAVYAIGDNYFCCPPAGRPPAPGYAWPPPAAQFFAGREGRTLYVASAADEV